VGQRLLIELVVAQIESDNKHEKKLSQDTNRAQLIIGVFDLGVMYCCAFTSALLLGSVTNCGVL